MPRRPSGPANEASPLRRARMARNWTLEQLVEEIDLRAPGGHSGVTASMVSGWELGRHTTSINHRKTLCDIYRQPSDVLLAHQDENLTARSVPRLLAGHPDMQRANAGKAAHLARIDGDPLVRHVLSVRPQGATTVPWPTVIAIM